VQARVLPSVLAASEQRLTSIFAAHDIEYPPRSATFIVLKNEARLELWADTGAAWKFVRSYLVKSSSGGLGPKLRRGDHQVPEGIYSIAALNPDSRFHLSLRVDYPSPFDLARASEDGRRDLGGDIMIHGGAKSDGCVPIGDPAIEELFALTARIGTSNVHVILSPFDFRRAEVASAAARSPLRPSWLRGLYADIATALKEFAVPQVSPPAVAPRVVARKPKCKPYDAADCVARCKGGDAPSCARAGLLYEGERGIAADFAKASALLGEACGRGDALGCAELSRTYLTDQGPGPDAKRSAELAQVACDGGDARGCVYLVELCSDRTIYPGERASCSPEFERRLYERAVALLDGSCAGWGAFDCYTLATMYEASDRRLASRFAKGACANGDRAACEELTRLRSGAGDLAALGDGRPVETSVGFVKAGVEAPFPAESRQ